MVGSWYFVEHIYNASHNIVNAIQSISTFICISGAFLVSPLNTHTDRKASPAVFGYVDLEICKQECEDSEEIEVLLTDKKWCAEYLQKMAYEVKKNYR